MAILIQPITAYQTWPLRHEVMWPNMPLDYVKLPNDEHGIHYGLFEDGELISVVSLFVIDGAAQFRKFATSIDKQGKGFGTQLLSFLMNEVKTLDVSRVWCNARSDKTSFYHKFGLKETAHSFVKSGQSYIVMERTL